MTDDSYKTRTLTKLAPMGTRWTDVPAITLGHALLEREGLVFGVLLAKGDVCPDCGHGTCRTSERWARCKRCGVRVRRRPDEEALEMLRAALEEHES